MDNLITTEIVQSLSEKGARAQLTCVGETLIFGIGDDQYVVDLNVVIKKITKHKIKINNIK